MRPLRFQQLLLDAASGIPGVVRAATLADAGHTTHPFGIAVEAGGRTTKWQVVGLSAPGDQYSQPERDPVLGEKLPARETPELTSDLATVERALVAAVLAADAGEIAAVDIYSGQPTPPAVGHGATFGFHDGSKVFLNAVR